MSEDSLKHLPLDDLFDLMVKSVNELVAMHKNHENVVILKNKHKEVEILQSLILAKRAENMSHSNAPY